VIFMIRVLFTFLLLTGATFGYESAGNIIGQNIGDQYGNTLVTMDFNDDGFEDLVVAAPAADDNGTSSGKVYIYFGGPAADTLADLTLTGAASSFFGMALASGGDFNHDGAEDLLVGAPFYDSPAENAGAVYLFYGGTVPDNTPDHIFTGESLNDYYGTAVAGVGDFNFDGYSDIAVGAYKADWGSYADAGKVYIYYGGDPPDMTVDEILVGETDGERFGYALCSGDFSGSVPADIAVGAYSYDSSLINQGRIYMFYGGMSPDTLADLVITGDSAGNKFGWSLTSGKINADGYDDLLMGTDGYPVGQYSAGHVYLYDGGPTVDDVPLYTYTLNRSADDLLGAAVASGLDLDGDGYEEFLSGMPGNSDGASLAGGAVLFKGGTSVSVDTSFLGTAVNEQMGKAVCFWSDFGSSFAVVLGAYAYDDYRGRIHLFTVPVSNRRPVLSTIGNKYVDPGENLNFNVTAVNPDGPAPELSTTTLPGTASFDDLGDGTGTFDWTPTGADVGPHEVTFIAFDGELADSELVVITVIDTTSCCVGFTGNANCSASEDPDISDITRLIDFLYLSHEPLCCPEEADSNGSGGEPDISDITKLIDHLYLTQGPLADCS